MHEAFPAVGQVLRYLDLTAFTHHPATAKRAPPFRKMSSSTCEAAWSMRALLVLGEALTPSGMPSQVFA